MAQRSYGIANGRVSYDSASKPGFGAGAWIKNITDREYLGYGLAHATHLKAVLALTTHWSVNRAPTVSISRTGSERAAVRRVLHVLVATAPSAVYSWRS
jgi:hypothetical protein